jgi:hypothetical protein
MWDTQLVAPAAIGLVDKAHRPPWRWVGPAVAVISFVLYAGTLFALPQMRDVPLYCELSSLAAAVSNVVYRAPLGTVYSDVLQHFLPDNAGNWASMQQTLSKARWAGVEPGVLLKTTEDGNGVGYVVFATAAVRLFGLHLWALPAFMLALMGISGIAFLRRFSSDLASVVVLYFCSLTVMLFTPLVSHPGILGGTAPGGIRYFSLVAILPAFHILFDMTKISSFNISVRNYLLLPIQVAIFAFAVLVRGSAASLIGTILLVWLVLAWQNRRNPRRFWLLLGKLAILVLIPVVLVGTIALLVPRDYLTQGRFGTVVWHRVFTSLGLNPAYPFPGVNEMFDCKRYIPQGIVPGISDSNGGCVWRDYTIRHHISETDTVLGTYGGRYETAVREAFFKIARRYPGEVLATFFYYKPPLILDSLRQSIKIDMSAYPPLAIGLLVAALANLLVYFFSPIGQPTANTRWLAGLTLLCTAFSIPQLLVVWALPNTAADLFFFCIFGVGLALGTAVAAGTRLALRREPSTIDWRSKNICNRDDKKVPNCQIELSRFESPQPVDHPPQGCGNPPGR